MTCLSCARDCVCPPRTGNALYSRVGMTLAFTVPGPPVPCERARTVRSISKRGERVRTFTPDRTAKYKKHVAMFALQAVQAHRQMWPKGAQYAITVRIYRKADRGDWDNFIKGVQDSCKGILWTDDNGRYVVKGTGEFPRGPDGWGIDRKNPRVEVEVEVVG